MAQRKGSVSTKEDVKCGICIKNVGDKEPGIQCELCEKWFYTSCVKIPDEVYKVLGKIPNLHWFCELCNSGAQKILVNLTKVCEKVDQIEIEQRNNTADIKKIREHMDKVDMEIIKLHEGVNNISTKMTHLAGVEQRVVDFREVMRQQLEDELEKNVHQNIKKQVEESMEKISDDLQDVRTSLQETRTHADEQREKAIRRNNIVIYRVPESEADSREDRNKADLTFCLQLFNIALNAGVDEGDVDNVLRLGRPGQAPRPLLVQLVSYTTKNRIMQNLGKLRDADSKYKSVVIAHDMTVQERIDCKRLVEEAKDMANEDTSGEYLYRVRGLPGQMTIVKIRKRNQ